LNRNQPVPNGFIRFPTGWTRFRTATTRFPTPPRGDEPQRVGSAPDAAGVQADNGFTTALILTFSPGEKERPAHAFGFADDRPANPVAGFSKRRRTFLPLRSAAEGRGPG